LDKAPAWKWFIEYTHPTQAHMHGISHYIFNGQTKYQSIEFLELDFYGRCLLLDGKIQSAQYDEYIYHEALIHPAMILNDAPKKVLVLGGGEGAVLREILKHPSVERLVMVDIDRDVVEMCAKYLPEWNDGAYQDPRVEVVFGDAREYVINTQEAWDVVVMDLTEPVDDGPSYLMFTKEFFHILKEKMAPGAILSLQAGSFNPWMLECHSAVYHTIKLAFDTVRSYYTFIPSFDATWGFITASKDRDPLALDAQAVDKVLAERGIDALKHYDGQAHTGMFALPKDIRTMRDKEVRIIEDDNPLIIF
jgi:spermidine synthase